MLAESRTNGAPDIQSHHENRNPLAPLENSAASSPCGSPGNKFPNGNSDYTFDSTARYRLRENDNFKLDATIHASPSVPRRIGLGASSRNVNNNSYSDNRNVAAAVSSPFNPFLNLQNQHQTENASPIRQHRQQLAHQDFYSIRFGDEAAKSNSNNNNQNTNVAASVANSSIVTSTNQQQVLPSPQKQDQQQQQQQQQQLLSEKEQHHLFISRLTQRLRTYFLHYSPGMTSSIENLIRRYAHREHDLWVKLFAKYGPFPDQQKSKEKSSVVRSDLVRYFRHYDPLLEGKVDDILAAFRDFPDAMWKSLEVKYGPRDDVFRPKQKTARPKNNHNIVGEDDDEEEDDEFDDDSDEGDNEEQEQQQQQSLSATQTTANTSGSFSTLSRKSSFRSGGKKKSKKVVLPMDLASRLRRFFERWDPDKVSRTDEIAMNYRFNEVELRDALELMYSTNVGRKDELSTPAAESSEGQLVQRQQEEPGNAQLEPPPGGFKQPASQQQQKESESAKKLRISTGSLSKLDAERWCVAFCEKYAPEKMDEVELILSRFQGKETQLREAMETVFGQVVVARSSVANVSGSPPQAHRSAEMKKRRRDAEARKKRLAQESGGGRGGEIQDDDDDDDVDDNEVELEGQLTRAEAGGGISSVVAVAVAVAGDGVDDGAGAKNGTKAFPGRSADFSSFSPSRAAKAAVASPKREARLALKKRLERFFNAYDKSFLPKCGALAKKFLHHEKELFVKLTKIHGREPATDSMNELFRERLTKIYRRHAPENIARIDELLQHHAGREEELLRLLTVKYGPEPEDSVEDEQHKLDDTNLRLHAFFQFYEPSQIPNIDHMCSVYGKGKEHQLWRSLFQLYGPYPKARKDFSSSLSSALAAAAGLTTTKKLTAFEQRLQAHNGGKLDLPTKKRMLKFFSTYDPAKINEIARIYQVFVGREEEMWNMLTRHYGPEPREETLTSQIAIDKSRRDLRFLFEKYFEHYDPACAWEIPDLVTEYLGREYEARVYLAARYGPEPTYNPLAVDMRKRLILFFRQYDPPQLANVDVIAEAYLGMDDQLFELLTQQYGGPEPNVGRPTNRSKFRDRLLRYFREYPEAGQAANRMENLEHIVRKHDEWDDEYMMDLVAEFGPEPPDPEAEALAKENEVKMSDAKKTLERRLGEFFTSYDRDQLANVATLVESYWDQPEELFKMLYEAYSIETEEVAVPAAGPTGGGGAHEQPEPEEPSHPPSEINAELLERVRRMYLKYNKKLYSQAAATLERYKDREGDLLDALVNKYGPEPHPDEDLTEEVSAVAATPTPTTVLRPIRPPAPPQDASRGRSKRDARDRVVEILSHCDPSKLSTVDKLLKRYVGMEDDLIDVLEERYELRPGTLQKLSEKLAVDTSEYDRQQRERMEQIQQQQDEEMRRTPRDRLLRLWQYYDPPRIPQLEVLLQRYDGREDELIQSQVKELGEEPAGDVHIRYRLLKFYNKYNPEKKGDIDTVMTKFVGREAQLMKMFLVKYGPEPPDPQPLPPLPEKVMRYRRSIKRRVQNIYSKYAPEKLSSLYDVLDRYEGDEENLLEQLDRKYSLSAEDLCEDPEQFADFRDRLVAIYRKNAPEKLSQVNDILKKYRGYEENLFDQLAVKYPEIRGQNNNNNNATDQDQTRGGSDDDS